MTCLPAPATKPDLVVIPIVKLAPAVEGSRGGAMIPQTVDYGLFDRSRAPSAELAKSGVKHHLIARFADHAEAARFAALPDLMEALRLMVEANPPFVVRPIGAPHSEQRRQQDQQIVAHARAVDALKRAGLAGTQLPDEDEEDEEETLAERFGRRAPCTASADIPGDAPLVRTGPGGDFNQDYPAGASTDASV